MTKKHLIKVAKQEIEAWDSRKMPRGLVLAILWAYVERLVNGEPIEETFLKTNTPAIDYEI